MGLDGKFLPDAFLKRIAPDQRKAMKLETFAEADSRGAAIAEKEMHRQFVQWLQLHSDRLDWAHCRMDKATTIEKGWPDFTVIKGDNVICIEFKAVNGVVSEAQQSVIDRLRSHGTKVFVLVNVADAIRAVENFL